MAKLSPSLVAAGRAELWLEARAELPENLQDLLLTEVGPRLERSEEEIDPPESCEVRIHHRLQL